jgi:very-short-patch-repair endonuclease
LIIEIDGSQHYTPIGKQKDDFRTEILEGYDLKIIRFTNKQIDDNFLAVCKYIDKVVKTAIT